MTGTPVDPGKARELATSALYTYDPTERGWLRDRELWSIDAAGAVASLSTTGLPIGRPTRDLLAAAASDDGRLFCVAGQVYALLVEDRELVAHEA